VIKDQSTTGFYQCWWVIFYFYEELSILKKNRMILVPQKNLGRSNFGLVLEFVFQILVPISVLQIKRGFG
jgi:hypothetical protein